MQHRSCILMLTVVPKVVVKMTNTHLIQRSMNVTAIDEEMYWGKRPAKFARRARSSSGKLMMVHGYCAAGNPFEKNAADFSDALYFKVRTKATHTNPLCRSLRLLSEPWR